MAATPARARRVAPRLAIVFLSTPRSGVSAPCFARALSSRGAAAACADVDPFRTVIPIETRLRSLTYSDPLFFVGSCFSDNVGGLASSAKLPALRNPFGVQYNGSSIARCLRRISDGEPYRADELGQHPTTGLWHSLDHHSRYDDADRDRCLDSINADLFAARDFLGGCRHAYVTLGSAFVFDAVDPSLRPLRAVANCHKLPARMFQRRIQSVDEIQEALLSCYRSLADLNPDVSVTFTVSPVRHWKDGPVNNGRSKAHLLAAAHGAVEEINSDRRPSAAAAAAAATDGRSSEPAADYFPSYEILLDELRDYRFYDEDMLHPSPLAVGYIWERLLDAHFDRKGRGGVDETMERVTAVGRALAHRPFDPEGEAHRTFLRRQLDEMEQLEREVPTICFAEEKKVVKEQMDR